MESKIYKQNSNLQAQKCDIVSTIQTKMSQYRVFWYVSYMRIPLTNAHADVSSKARCIDFGLSLHLNPYFEYLRNKGSDECALLADAKSTKLLITGTNLF